MASNSGETPRSKKYRQYLRNASAPVPRTTLWRRLHNTGSNELASLRAKRSEITSTQNSSASEIPIPTDPIPIPESPSSPHSFCDSSSPSLSNSSSSPSIPIAAENSFSSSSSTPSNTSPSLFCDLPSPFSSPPSCNASLSPDSSSRSSPNNSFIHNCSNLPDPDPETLDTSFLTPLYPGAKITLCGALCAIMLFCSQNKLTYTAIGELLQLLHVICPPSQLPKSFYHFKKFFKMFSQDHVHEKICLKCEKSCCSCPKSLQCNAAHLVSNIEIGKSLETIISRNWEALHSPTRLSSTLSLEDVWDGSVLRSMSGPGRYFSNTHNLALALSTDGVPLYKSSTVSIWPVYLVILNLPAHIRMNAENIILCGVWVGPTKPLMNLLLDPICSYLKHLSTQGMLIKTSYGEHTFRGKLVMGLFDLPAKAAVLYTKQFNGKFGCSVCIHPGKRLPNNARVYLPDTKYDERTHAQFLEFGESAEATGNSVQGIVGISPFSSILDMVASIPIDYMHNVLEGVMKWLMRAWFESKHHSQPYYVGRSTKLIDENLLKQCPPSEFSRPPRSIKKHFKYWKASEFRYWLLFYSLPLLQNVLPSLYWHHYALLVCAMHILLSDSISHAQVDAAELMLNEFYTLLPELYGESSCTANAHLLSHLTKYVRLWGPLWTHSLFGAESKNGQIKHFFHGKSDILHQLLFNIDVSETLQFLHRKLIEHESEETLQYLYPYTYIASQNSIKKIGSRSYIVGKCYLTAPTSEQSSVLGSSGNFEVFTRLLKCGVLYHSTSYERSSSNKRCNIYCCYPDTNGICLGKLELFVKTPRTCVLLRQLQKLGTTLISGAGPPCRESLSIFANADLLSSYIIPVNISTDHCPLLAVDIIDIVSKVVLVSVVNNYYCVIQPNNIERH